MMHQVVDLCRGCAGSIGDITFYKTRDGFIAREKTSIDAKRIATDPAFQRTRENGAEFGRAGKASKLLRATFKPYFKDCADSRMSSRLTQAMMKVVQADTVSVRGMRNVIDGEAELLQGFEFNSRGRLTSTLYAPFAAAIDRVTGEVRVDIEAFVPATMIDAPGGTTHYRIVSAGAEIDFEGEAFVVAGSETAILPYDNVPSAAISQVNTVPAASTRPLFLVLGVEFYQEINGQMYPLKNGAHNPLSVVRVDGGV
jgi:hypothetical protein